MLFADQRAVVLDKPAGLKVHPGPGGGASVEDWFPRLSRHSRGPWLAHRLDADTAGCLVVALRSAALREIQACFAEGRADKTYWAIVHGAPPAESGSIAAPLARQAGRTGWRMVSAPHGQPARTEYVVRGRAGGFAWLELRLHSGRTHQARVHCASLGCPIAGDAVYGAAASGLQLLARAITLPLRPPICAVAPPPAHMRALLGACGYEGGSP